VSARRRIELSRRRAAALGLAAVVVAVAVAAAFGAFAAAGQPRWIVFSAAPSGAQIQPQQLYRIQASGDGLQQITTGGSPAVEPAFSPGGARIAFARLGVGIFTINPDGTGLRRLTKGARDTYPTWSPAGGQIAFVRPVGSKWRLYVVSTSGGAPRLLAKSPSAGRPSWTKAGLLVPSLGDLLRVDPKTGRVLKYYGANIDAIWGLNTVALAPDLSKLSYVGARAPEPGDKECGEGPCQRFGLYLESLKTKAKKPRMIVKDTGPAAFSPDGSQLAYAADNQLVLRSMASGATHTIDTGAVYPTSAAPPAWQP
jgi:dipeptidyl aminopeptidase/acylaminoacyl peptidase